MRSFSFTKSSRPTKGEEISQGSSDNHLQHASKEKSEIGAVRQPLVAVRSEVQNQQTPPGDAQRQVEPENEIEYPHGLKLATISIAVALSVFLVALVSFYCGPFTS
jgi:hypothetical protein